MGSLLRKLSSKTNISATKRDFATKMTTIATYLYLNNGLSNDGEFVLKITAIPKF